MLPVEKVVVLIYYNNSVNRLYKFKNKIPVLMTIYVSDQGQQQQKRGGRGWERGWGMEGGEKEKKKGEGERGKEERGLGRECCH